MKIWKLVAGILSMLIFVIVMVQSCAAGAVNAIENNGGNSGFVGFVCGLLILSGGIVSVAMRNAKGKGGDITLIVLFGLSALFGFTGYGNYEDLVFWSLWSAVNMSMAIISIAKKNKNG